MKTKYEQEKKEWRERKWFNILSRYRQCLSYIKPINTEHKTLNAWTFSKSNGKLKSFVLMSTRSENSSESLSVLIEEKFQFSFKQT